ncbi:DUF4129 domain-containing protein [Halopelagius fulvigenes]|uniref:DUF4129 domain-containing protein n=1 Tax=Halopelagius fulvigenes TaxID=1198324 RepID=A0ABD5U268_9EURY
MNVRAIATLVVAFACITSVGVASTTLQSSVSSTPDEVINVGHDLIPLSQSDTGTLKRAMTGEEGSGGASTKKSSDGSMTKQASGGDGSEQRHQRRDDGSSGQQQKDVEKNKPAGSSSSEGNQPEQSVGGIGEIPDPGQSWLPLLAAVLVLALLVYYRDRVASFLEPPEGNDPDEPVGVPAPKNDIERAWLTVVGATRVDNPWRKTPAECAAAAVENGLDPDAVQRIRRVFEEVKYGEREVTEDRRDEVRRNLARLDVRTDLRADGGEER